MDSKLVSIQTFAKVKKKIKSVTCLENFGNLLPFHKRIQSSFYWCLIRLLFKPHQNFVIKLNQIGPLSKILNSNLLIYLSLMITEYNKILSTKRGNAELAELKKKKAKST
ncbi:hypothetical protein BpHYR1_016694 [Brachionus plicatilis]|uniref:Uncharacterized protein n=1 Tax=Brachionus plicatilis TaxID=10195 RepID=A0A3M7RGY0_BRAPC|nr:hypothetical protein BpHYR1_016694 [Brachionus plicatilis]